MTIATLIDNQIADQNKIDSLYKEKLLKKANVFTFADFTKTVEADIEDMFGDAFYFNLVNAEFAAELASPLDAAHVASRHPKDSRSPARAFRDYPFEAGEIQPLPTSSLF